MSDDVPNCGFALYGPPAICTCGGCDDPARLHAELAALRTLLVRAKEVLGPFAEAFAALHPNYVGPPRDMTLADLRRASSLLSEIEKVPIPPHLAELWEGYQELRRAAEVFRDRGTKLTSCSQGACQQVIEHDDNSDPQAKLFDALRKLEASDR